MTDDAVLTERQQLEKELAALRKAEADKAEAANLDELRLTVRFTKELGPQGSEWAMLRTPDGPIVVARGDVLFYRKLVALKPDQETSNFKDADLHAVIAPQVKYPEPARFAELAEKRGGVRAMCVFLFKQLHEAYEEVKQGK